MIIDRVEIKGGRVVTKDAAKTEELTITLRDPDGSLIKFLKHLALTANPGHSFGVVVDPDGDKPQTFGFDGDGAFYIESINGSKEFKDAGEVTEEYSKKYRELWSLKEEEDKKSTGYMMSPKQYLIPEIRELQRKIKEKEKELELLERQGKKFKDALDAETIFQDMLSKDQVNYYDLIVAVARQMNNIRPSKEAIKSRIQKMFEAVTRTGAKYLTGEPVKFSETEFAQAFHEFSNAGYSRAAFSPT